MSRRYRHVLTSRSTGGKPSVDPLTAAQFEHHRRAKT